jgi:uncharacterized protein with LGFP repeats
VSDKPEEPAKNPNNTEVSHNAFTGQAPVNTGSGDQINHFSMLPPEDRLESAQPGEFEHLSNGAIHRQLATLSPHRAASTLATLPHDKAADVFRLMAEKRRIDVIQSMDPRPAESILRHLPDDLASPLRLAVMAAQAIATDAADWHRLLGEASGDLERRGHSKRGAPGYASHYERGTVYWSEATGTGTVAGEIKARYWGLGGHSGLLGYPIGPETQAATSKFGTSGTFQRFESTWDYGPQAIEKTLTVCGATMYASAKGVFATRGGIGEYYEKSGGTWGLLGFPLSDEIAITGPEDDAAESRRQKLSGDVPEAYRQEFEGGTLYWSEKTGVAHVHPAIEEVIGQTGIDHGLPLGEQEVAEGSQQGTTGVVQRFQLRPGIVNTSSMLVYSGAQIGTWTVSGAILRYFEGHGGTAGRFGFPTGAVRYFVMRRRKTVVREQVFETGQIIDCKGRSTVGVAGSIYAHWRGHRLELGLPIAEQRPIEAGPDLIQCFEGGVVTVIDGTAVHWRSPAAAARDPAGMQDKSR